jgi:TPR repeat protein
MHKPVRTFLGALIAALVVVGTAVAGPFEDGGAAYQRGDYATAMRIYRSLADQGNAVAQGNVGAMYENSRGVPQNYAEAMRWYRKAADQGNADAQTNLGFMYENGRGVAQNSAEAVRWYRKAADQGNAKAQGNLGVMYENGRGVPQDYAEARRWYRKAANLENVNARASLSALSGQPTAVSAARDIAKGPDPTWIVVVLLVVVAAVYFLPTIIAKARKHNNSMAIFALNFLAGWTFLGWVVAFVWALTADVKYEIEHSRPPTLD